ncbi:MAG: aminomethyl transferase family protein [Halobacteriovoraceae bacterium]|jgi:aminomethyltransferase|nr:aminomethyl transferase family protein [Halobacteriovoraceae bacterium]MBT5095188.1 aminomethyl transferase family protein [Halobacteriovoraceae bacterium]
MPIQSPFHPRTAELCTSMRWKEWAGYYAVSSYEASHEIEYAAVRHSAGLIDVTPLFKYNVYGSDATEFLTKIMAKNISKLKIGQVSYCCWCDDEGELMDDGTVTRLEENYYRVTAAEPCLYWFNLFTRGLEITLEDVTADYGGLAIQGPNSRKILDQICTPLISDLKFFWSMKSKIAGHEVLVTRTGYTGDLGYEVWVENQNALAIYDAISVAGDAFGLRPLGLDALDITRVEAGFIMNGVDYFSANHCLIDERKSTPYEVGLGWTVSLKDRGSFIGHQRLRQEKSQGAEWGFVGLVMDWDDMERLYADFDLPPQICSHAWRDGRPVYNLAGDFIGQATSGAWSPLLKKNLALATLKSEYCQEGTELYMELTVEYQRLKVKAVVTKTPFYNPKRKRQ